MIEESILDGMKTYYNESALDRYYGFGQGYIRSVIKSASETGVVLCVLFGLAILLNHFLSANPISLPNKLIGIAGSFLLGFLYVAARLCNWVPIEFDDYGIKIVSTVKRSILVPYTNIREVSITHASRGRIVVDLKFDVIGEISCMSERFVLRDRLSGGMSFHELLSMLESKGVSISMGG